MHFKQFFFDYDYLMFSTFIILTTLVITINSILDKFKEIHLTLEQRAEYIVALFCIFVTIQYTLITF